MTAEDCLLTALSQNLPYPWYALKVRTRSESLVGTCLTNKSYEAFVPTQTQARAYSDRIKRVEVALFPGYLFCRLDAQRRLPVLTTPGVEYILGLQGNPHPIPEAEIGAIMRVVESGAEVKPWPFLKTGDKVRVVFGSFSGVEGILISEKGAERLILSVTLLQRSVAVEIDRTWIEPLK